MPKITAFQPMLKYCLKDGEIWTDNLIYPSIKSTDICTDLKNKNNEDGQLYGIKGQVESES